MSNIQSDLARAWQLHQAKQFGAAEKIYRDVISKSSQNPNAWCYLGIVLHDTRRYAEAVEAYEKALALQPTFPIALNNMGNSLRYVGQYQRADQCFQQAIDQKPDYVNAYKNRGTLHVWTGGLDLGFKYYREALKLNPNDAELHRNLGVIHLLKGNYAEGWNEYRWRWKVGDLFRPKIPAPVWDGSDLKGKSIVLTAEQGLGDTLHFVRFAPVLREMGARTTVYCQPPLLALLQQSLNLGAIYPDNLALNQKFDFQCSLLDVADILKVDESKIPANTPYIHPSANLVEYWRSQLNQAREQLGGKFRVGIAWQGNPDHQADAFRSFPLKHFERLASIPDVNLISLQAGHGLDQLSQWSGESPVQYLGDQIDKSSGAFMDTAAIMKSLDLVITTDTALAHLAGALNVPTWVVLGYTPDWRWLLNRSDSPWYPSTQLFRQPEIGDWDSAFEQVEESLKELVATR